MKKHNFSAGPAILPAPVIKEAAEAVANWKDMGLSVLEVSHRGKDFVQVLEEAVSLTRELLELDDNYAVLFLTGGASSQFFMTAMNLLGDNETAHFIDTGSWSTKAIKEAKLFGNVNVLASSKDKNYTYIPKGLEIPDEGRYLHITTNNTIYGTQYHKLPDTTLPIVADMSSDIFSRPLEINRFGLIYAGAQKNLGPAGTTLVIVRKDLLRDDLRSVPTMLDYHTHIKKNSAFNTPPVFPIFVCMLTMRWLKAHGGLSTMQERNEEKAKLFYAEVDRNSLFEGVAEIEDRSQMNATFVAKDATLNDSFLEACQQAGCIGVKGHRSVGGFRASLYNAMPIESVEVLVEVMRNFEKKHG